MATIVEFRRICGHSKDSDRFLTRVKWPSTSLPVPGNVINIDGEPYTVTHDLGYAFSAPEDTSSFLRLEDIDLYVYIRLSPLQHKERS